MHRVESRFTNHDSRFLGTAKTPRETKMEPQINADIYWGKVVYAGISA